VLLGSIFKVSPLEMSFIAVILNFFYVCGVSHHGLTVELRLYYCPVRISEG